MFITLSIRESLSDIVTLSVGLLVPIYYTYMAINKSENKKEEDSKEKDKWLRYWTVFGSFLIITLITNLLLSWFPFYYELKMIASLLIVTPKINLFVYHCICLCLQPFEKKIEEIINEKHHNLYILIIKKFGLPGRLIYTYLFDENFSGQKKKMDQSSTIGEKKGTKVDSKLQLLKNSNTGNKKDNKISARTKLFLNNNLTPKTKAKKKKQNPNFQENQKMPAKSYLKTPTKKYLSKEEQLKIFKNKSLSEPKKIIK
ncbi:receptor expression-enhancing protein [Anaeramoeba flamelloides]|uniref:Receptor expression-enhancing protein n=1 Tax=Anaeramoeba flamelloides TaxID=1746091 RepID=A0ABQ8Y309_9EUKA|nr:receptor expression-enhancing protein [Anaeramoeba flamelloides]